MPYEWLPPSGDPATRLHLWPHRSLSRRGFVAFIGVTAALISLPLASLIGNPALWVLLPFLILAVAGIWWALMRSYRDAQIIEDLTLTRDQITLTRHGPRGKRQEWNANPHWVQVILHATDGPVPNYLTLRGGPREVELGAFLSEPERLTLSSELRNALAQNRP
jgi:uncharacterized membrane protein